MIGPMRHGSPPRLMAPQSILSPNRRESLPAPSAGVRMTPCSADTFRILYGDEAPHRGCFGNLAAALVPYGIAPDRIPVAFNVFMNVTVDGSSGALRVEPPLSKAGDYVSFEAEQDLIIGLFACSALQSNNSPFKPTTYEIS